MTKLKPSDRQRLKSINYIMDELYDGNAVIYESLVDMEFNVCYEEITRQIIKLKDIQESLKDEL